MNFAKARTKIRSLATRSRNQLPILEVASVPCFEVWILLHFEQTDASFNECDSVIQRVRQHMPEYKKADRHCVKQLLALLETALANARWLATRTGIADENPSTTVLRVIEHLRAVSASA
ncbi:MAG: RloB domain-containing protein [Steroidobacteraceae bacterium]